MTIHLMEFLLKYFRACPLCHTSFKPVEWLCEICEGKIMSQIQHHRRWIGNSIEHHYLFEWKPKDPQISKLVYSLKGWGFLKPYKIFSKIILNHMETDWLDLKTPLNSPEVKRSGPNNTHTKVLRNLFYPSQGHKDHALMLAHSLGTQMEVSPQPLIKQKTTLKQALLKRKERYSIKMKTSSWKGSQALLVDDIVTTGATVRACYKALNKPSKLIVWSLFYRKSL